LAKSTPKPVNPFEGRDCDSSRLRGKPHRSIFLKLCSLVRYHFTHGITNGIRGYLLHGPTGTGKTTIVKCIARDLMSPLFFVDGSHIAHHRYGESERAIRSVFAAAAEEGRSIILIDDAESVFPRRDWVKGESWHVAQNNVLFHELDGLDTSKSAVFFTTNELSIMDPAIVDRLYLIEVGVPEPSVILEIAKDRALELGLDPGLVVKHVSEAGVRTFRKLEQLVIELLAERALREY